MPDKENKTLKFNHFQKELPVPFIVYADFETITEKIKTCTPENQSYTEAYQKHTQFGYGYKVVCCYDDKFSKPVQIYRGENSVYKFMEKMIEKMIKEVENCNKKRQTRNISKNH